MKRHKSSVNYDKRKEIGSIAFNKIEDIFLELGEGREEVQFLFNEIRELSSSTNVAFRREIRSAYSMADIFGSARVERMYPWVGVVI